MTARRIHIKTVLLLLLLSKCSGEWQCGFCQQQWNHLLKCSDGILALKQVLVSQDIKCTGMITHASCFGRKLNYCPGLINDQFVRKFQETCSGNSNCEINIEHLVCPKSSVLAMETICIKAGDAVDMCSSKQSGVGKYFQLIFSPSGKHISINCTCSINTNFGFAVEAVDVRRSDDETDLTMFTEKGAVQYRKHEYGFRRMLDSEAGLLNIRLLTDNDTFVDKIWLQIRFLKNSQVAITCTRATYKQSTIVMPDETSPLILFSTTTPPASQPTTDSIPSTAGTYDSQLPTDSSLVIVGAAGASVGVVLVASGVIGVLLYRRTVKKRVNKTNEPVYDTIDDSRVTHQYAQMGVIGQDTLTNHHKNSNQDDYVITDETTDEEYNRYDITQVDTNCDIAPPRDTSVSPGLKEIEDKQVPYQHVCATNGGFQTENSETNDYFIIEPEAVNLELADKPTDKVYDEAGPAYMCLLPSANDAAECSKPVDTDYSKPENPGYFDLQSKENRKDGRLDCESSISNAEYFIL